MYKLNNRGWGLGVMLVFICVFLIAIIFIAIQAKEYGLAGDNSFATPIPTKTPVVSATPDVSANKESYERLEERSEEAGRVYKETYYKSLLDGDSVYVTIKKLVSNSYLEQLRDLTGNVCSGYVKITGGEEFQYDAYIKCKDYETSGYLDYLDH